MVERNAIKSEGIEKSFWIEAFFYGESGFERVLNLIITVGLILLAGASSLSVAGINISLLLLIAPAFILKVIIKKGKPIRRTPLDIPIIVYFSVILITSLASYRVGGWSYVRNSLYWYISIGISFITFYLVFYNAKKRIRKYLLVIFSLSAVVNCVYALIQYYNCISNRLDPTFIRPSGFISYVTYLSISVFAGLVALYFIFDDDKKFRIFGWISFIIITAGILFSISRASIITYFFSLLTYILLSKKYIYIIIIGLIFISLFFVPDIVMERLQDTFISEDGGITLNLNERFDERGSIYRTGWEIIKNHPVLGVGTNNIYAEYFKHRTLDSEYVFIDLHNNFLNITAESGLIGLSAFVFLLIYLIKELIKRYKQVNNRNLSFLSTSIVIAFFITGLGFYTVGDKELLNAFFFILALSLIKKDEGDVRKD